MFAPHPILMPPSHPRMSKELEYAYDKRWEKPHTTKKQQPYAFTPGDVVTIYNQDEVDPTFNMPFTFVDTELLKP